MSNKLAIKFKLAELKALVEDSQSCVKCIRRKQHLSISPWCLTDLKASIENILNKKITKYDHSLDGILLSAKNIALLSTLGALRHDSPEIHINIEADFYIFQPKIGSILEGVVSKKSSNILGCLVHKVFNISIPNISDQLNWPGKRMEIGQNVTFKIVSMDLLGKLPYIRGEIDMDTVEDMTYLEEFTETPEEIESAPIKKRKRNKIKEEVQDTTAIEMVENEVIENTQSTKKRNKKKNKHKEQEDMLSLQNSLRESSFDQSIDIHGNNSKEVRKTKKKKVSGSQVQENNNNEEYEDIKKVKRGSKHRIQNEIKANNNVSALFSATDANIYEKESDNTKVNNFIEHLNVTNEEQSPVKNKYKISKNNSSIEQNNIKCSKTKDKCSLLDASLVTNVDSSTGKSKSRDNLIDQLLKAAQHRTSLSPDKKIKKKTTKQSADIQVGISPQNSTLLNNVIMSPSNKYNKNEDKKCIPKEKNKLKRKLDFDDHPTSTFKKIKSK